eukprot:Clim_evm4s30 gene=Clim_evmTU4s30
MDLVDSSIGDEVAQLAKLSHNANLAVEMVAKIYEKSHVYTERVNMDFRNLDDMALQLVKARMVLRDQIEVLAALIDQLVSHVQELQRQLDSVTSKQTETEALLNDVCTRMQKATLPKPIRSLVIQNLEFEGSAFAGAADSYLQSQQTGMTPTGTAGVVPTHPPGTGTLQTATPESQKQITYDKNDREDDVPTEYDSLFGFIDLVTLDALKTRFLSSQKKCVSILDRFNEIVTSIQYRFDLIREKSIRVLHNFDDASISTASNQLELPARDASGTVPDAQNAAGGVRGRSPSTGSQPKSQMSVRGRILTEQVPQYLREVGRIYSKLQDHAEQVKRTMQDMNSSNDLARSLQIFKTTNSELRSCVDTANRFRTYLSKFSREGNEKVFRYARIFQEYKDLFRDLKSLEAQLHENMHEMEWLNPNFDRFWEDIDDVVHETQSLYDTYEECLTAYASLLKEIPRRYNALAEMNSTAQEFRNKLMNMHNSELERQREWNEQFLMILPPGLCPFMEEPLVQYDVTPYSFRTGLPQLEQLDVASGDDETPSAGIGPAPSTDT